jgi:uncharacterized protein YbjT (DUF2867 family)
MILITGATGNVGSQVVRELLSRDVPIRAFVRDGERARELLGDDVALAVGDFADQGSIRAALLGVERVFLSSADGPDKVTHEKAVIDAAAEAGVELIVKCSTLLAEAGSPLPPLDWHGRIEEHLRASAIPGVALHSCFYMTNLLQAAGTVRDVGKLFAPAGSGRIAMIDPRDTAAVAAHILASGGHEQERYAVTGPEAITYSRVAHELSLATGSAVEFVHVPDDAALEELVAAGMPSWLVAHLSALFPLVRENALASTAGTVLRLTGRPPRSFAEFAHDHADAFGPDLVAWQR